MRTMTLVATVTALATLSCGPRAVASSPGTAGASASPKPVSQVEPPTPDGDALEEGMISRLGLCWFSQPYDYMFLSGAGGSVHVGSGSWTSFIGGINGMLYYSGLNECVASELGGQASSYSDSAPFSKLAGLPIYSDKMTASAPFGQYNPAIVKWGHENLILPADMEVGGVGASQIYAVVFSRFFRMMTEAYLWLAQSGQAREETDAYMRMAKEGKEDGIEWLQARYQLALPAYGTSWDGTSMTPQMAIGFWLRRTLDGTAEELWVGLRKVMKRFDATWFASLPATYGSTSIDW